MTANALTRLMLGFLAPATLLFSSVSAAQSALTTDIYQKESSAKAFSATVKIVREYQGEWEVMFNGHNGFYVVSGDAQPVLVEAQKKKVNVLVKVDEEERRVLSATWGAPSAPAAGTAPSAPAQPGSSLLGPPPSRSN